MGKNWDTESSETSFEKYSPDLQHKKDTELSDGALGSLTQCLETLLKVGGLELGDHLTQTIR